MGPRFYTMSRTSVGMRKELAVPRQKAGRASAARSGAMRLRVWPMPWRRGRLWARGAACLLLAVGLLAGLAEAAWGHAFQVQTDPVQGARLDRAPDEVGVQLTEPVADSIRLTVHRASGETVPVGDARLEDNRILRVPLKADEEAIYLVSWQVVSAIDGHETAGEFYRLPEGDYPPRRGRRRAAVTRRPVYRRARLPPPQDDPDLLRELVARMEAAEQVELVEDVASGPGAEGSTTASVTGEQFVELMPYAAGEAAEVRPLPDGRPGLTVALPATPMWVTVWLDDQGRVREQLIVNPGHEIRHTVTYPDGDRQAR